MKALIFLCVVAGAALVYLMSEASANTTAFAQNLDLLLGVSGGLALGLMTLIGYQLATLRRKLRERVFGSKLTLRLMVVFALMALIPGGLVYAISFQFLQRSIESWFDVKVDDSLKGGINLAFGAMQNSLKELGDKAEIIAQSLATSQAIEAASLNRLREQYSVEEATLMTSRGRVIAQSGVEPIALLPDLPSSTMLRQYRLAIGNQYQNFTRFEEVTRVLSRLRGWHVADKGALKKDQVYQASLRMRLDTAQLPKPFQLNAIASRDWTLASDWHRWTITP